MNKGMDGLLGFYDILNTQIAAISKSHVNLFVNNNNNNNNIARKHLVGLQDIKCSTT